VRNGGIAGRLGVVALVVVVFVLGVLAGGHPGSSGLDRLPDGARRLLLGEDSTPPVSSQVLDLLRDHYYKDVNAGALERLSVDAMIRHLDDPYTQYLDPQALEALQADNDGLYFGVGLEVARRGTRIVVSGTFPGSPAARAGIRRGDVLVAVNGVRVRPGNLDRTVARIKGPKGTGVRLGVHRPPDRTLNLSLRREAIKVPVVSARVIGTGLRRVAYVRLAQFTRGSSEALRKALRARLDGVRGVVLDLRGNPGGLVPEAVGVASTFLAKGTPIVTTEGVHEKPVTLRAGSGAIPRNLGLAVLVDGNSASSSEIVAGALSDDKRGTLVGTRTFGKALVQTTVLLKGGGALKLTTARYLTPSGHDIGHRGLVPPVRVTDDPATRGDEALTKAVAVALRPRRG
jgi:carboxyl-terminal processing protease